MELNREQIIKQMQEWCDNMCENACLKGESLNGKVHTCEICFPNTVKNALSLIKELTEDNEYLKTQLTATEARYDSRKESDIAEMLELRLKVEELTEENERLRADCVKGADALIEEMLRSRAIKADTVREMQDRLDKHFCHDLAFLGVEQRLIMDIIDQIAKEMLEVEK